MLTNLPESWYCIVCCHDVFSWQSSGLSDHSIQPCQCICNAKRWLTTWSHKNIGWHEHTKSGALTNLLRTCIDRISPPRIGLNLAPPNSAQTPMPYTAACKNNIAWSQHIKSWFLANWSSATYKSPKTQISRLLNHEGNQHLTKLTQLRHLRWHWSAWCLKSYPRHCAHDAKPSLEPRFDNTLDICVP